MCGEALIDLTHGTADAPMHYVGHEGGGPCNTAVALGRLGTRTGFLGRISNDRFGQALRAHMNQSGVDLRYVASSSEPSMLAVATISEAGNAEYAFYLDGTADVGLSADALPILADSVKALHFGTLALALEPVGSALVALATRESRRRLIALDPNVRMIAIRNVEAYRKRIEALVSLADVVKMSDADIAALWPAATIDDTAQRLFRSGPALLCVTRGGDGCTVFHQDQRSEVAAEKVAVVDTIGAGDTFNAGLLHDLMARGASSSDAITALSTNEIRDCVSFAVRAAAVTCSRAGANPPWAHEVQ